MAQVKGLPILLPVYAAEYEPRRVVKQRWGFDYRRLFRTRREAIIANRKGLI